MRQKNIQRPRSSKEGVVTRKALTTCLLGVFGLWALAFVYTAFLSHNISAVDVALPAWDATLDRYLEDNPGLKYSSSQPPNASMKQHYFKLENLLSAWNPDDTSESKWRQSMAHPDQGKGVARFDYQNAGEMNTARAYEAAALPFVVYNVPDLNKAATGGFSAAELAKNFGSSERPIERSTDNHFMYYSKRKIGVGSAAYPTWEPPQQDITMSLSKFKVLAAEAGQHNLLNTANLRSEKKPLHYMTINAAEGAQTPWIKQALPFFDIDKYVPASPTHFSFIKDTNSYRGVNCRFGMRGVVAEAHFDGTDNYIAMVRGRKRYVLLPPSQCSKLSLLPKKHPSGRHSKLDWSDIYAVSRNDDLKSAEATEVVLRMGEILHLPSFWFHYIVSQDASIQCNSRSGTNTKGEEVIDACMTKAEAVEKREKEMDKAKEKSPASALGGVASSASEAADSLLDSMAHTEGLDLHPDRHFHHDNSNTAKSRGRIPLTRRNEFGSEQRQRHMDSGADMRMPGFMDFGEA
jgi:hypothetical protein